MDIQLQSVLGPDKDICTAGELYFHSTGREVYYDGYFNLFYIEKWKRYTSLEQLYLLLNAQGYEKLRLYHDRECVRELPLDAGSLTQYRLDFPWEQYDGGVFWFSLVQAKKVSGRCRISGFYMGACQSIRAVAIGIDICTYRREDYILHNLTLLCKKVLKNDSLQTSRFLWVYVVDNGKTLNRYKPLENLLESNDRISVIPNRNAGGAGGFTRGMLEVLSEKEMKKFTHIILMDDDALLNPDLFVRIYGFLRVVKDEWKDITLGGTMLREDLPYMLYASGESWSNGILSSQNTNLDLRNFDNACCEGLLTTRFEKEQYSGWWCCCYSLHVVREDNLPVPLFIHHDDIEFGLRNKCHGIVFLNGVSVWHKNLQNALPGPNLYYDVRNNLIEITQRYGTADASKCIWSFYWKRLAYRLLRNAQDEVYWFIRGASDFLKGPEWLWNQNPEQLHGQIRDAGFTGTARCWYESMKICVMLLAGRKRTVTDYQTNLKKYTTKQAWDRYLGLQGKEGS